MTVRLPIKLKLVLAFAAILLLSGVMAVFGIISLAAPESTLEQIVSDPVQRLQLVQSMDADLLLENRARKNVLLAGNPQEIARYETEEQAAAQQSQQHRGAWLAIGTAASREARPS